MVRKLADLRETPDEVLVTEHDAIATHTYVGTDYYVEELSRRAFERAAERSHQLARRSMWLAITNLIVSFIAIVVAVLAIVLG